MNRTIQQLAERISPAHRRWARTRRSLTLDPDSIPRPLEDPGPRDFLICGSPRTGTALLTAALFQPPTVITVMEPWDAMRLPPATLFRSLREELTTGQLHRGRLDVPALRRDGEVVWCRDGARPIDVEVGPDTLVGIKFPAFWQYLDLLPRTKFIVCVREPIQTVCSFEATGGRLKHGLDYDISFNRRVNEGLLRAFDNDAERRMGLYDLVNAKILEHEHRPEVHVVRFERWFTDPDALLDEVGAFLGVDLEPTPIVVRPTTQYDTVPAVRSAVADRLGYGSP